MIKKLSFFLLLTGLFFCANVFAQPELDTSFNGSGKFVVNVGGIGIPADILTQPDNKILMVTGCRTVYFPSYVPFCVFRVNENGSADTSFVGGQFNTPGAVLTTIPGMPFNTGGGTALALQNDGKIIAAGSGPMPSQNMYVLVRYNSNGSLDTTFGSSGVASGAITGDAYVADVALLPDGKIIIAGTVVINTVTEQFLARLNSNGTLDTTFGDSGVAKISVAGSNTRGASLAIQPDGRIVTGGSFVTGTSPSYLLARFNRSGTLDTTFDDDGYKTIPITLTTSQYALHSIAVQTDGRILGVGRNIIFRVNTDGSLDTSFNSTGSRTALPGNSESHDIYVSASGKITAVGIFLDNDTPYEYRVARYLPNGSPDTSFSDDGYLTIDVGSGIDGADAVTTDSIGRMVIGGRTAPGIISNPWENAQLSVARLSALPAQNVGFSGRVTEANGKAVVNAYITLKSGSDIIGYARTNPFGYFHFASVPTNKTYTLSTVSKGLDFYDQSVLVDGAIENYSVVSR